MQCLETKAKARIRELEIKERWFLTMLQTVGNCQQCKLYAQCESKSDCVKTMQRAADKHAYKVMTDE